VRAQREGAATLRPYAEAGEMIQIEHGRTEAQVGQGGEGGMFTSIEERRRQSKRFGEINAEFNTFRPASGPGEGRNRW
jgi:hypothetical protein